MPTFWQFHGRQFFRRPRDGFRMIWVGDIYWALYFYYYYINSTSDPWVGKIPWRREWQPTPGFLPGKSHGQWSLVGYSPWDCKRVECDLATKQAENNFYIRIIPTWSETSGSISTVLPNLSPNWSMKSLHSFLFVFDPPHGKMWDLGSLTSDRTCVLCTGSSES